jgi:hypothetical protein
VFTFSAEYFASGNGPGVALETALFKPLVWAEHRHHGLAAESYNGLIACSE